MTHAFFKALLGHGRRLGDLRDGGASRKPGQDGRASASRCRSRSGASSSAASRSPACTVLQLLFRGQILPPSAAGAAQPHHARNPQLASHSSPPSTHSNNLPALPQTMLLFTSFSIYFSIDRPTAHPHVHTRTPGDHHSAPGARRAGALGVAGCKHGRHWSNRHTRAMSGRSSTSDLANWSSLPTASAKWPSRDGEHVLRLDVRMGVAAAPRRAPEIR